MNKNSVYWYAAHSPKSSKPFSGSLKTTVAVIGGGMAGLSCAQKLHEAGVEVILLEQDFCGAGASGKSSGFITPDSEIELSSLVKNYGPAKAKRLWEFVISGLDLIQKNIRAHTMSCDYQLQDSLFIANSPAGYKHVKEEHEARKKLGYSSTLYPPENLQKIIGTQSYYGAVRYPKTFGINSYAYCLALSDVLRNSGVKIFEQTPVERIEGQTLFTPQGKIIAEHIVFCGDRFIPKLGALKKEIYHVQTFLAITKPLAPEQIKTLFPEKPMMVWDTQLVYNYYRLTGENRLLMGGGDLLQTYAHKPATNTTRFKRKLTQYFQEKFPSVPLEPDYLWSGMLGVSKDLLPIMGPDENNKNLWYVGAATGLPWAAALGTYAAERILTGRHDFDADFSPHRTFTVGSRLQALLGNPLTYALSHGKAKYL